MFMDLIHESSNSDSLQLSSAFDVQEFSGYLREAESVFDSTINSYRHLMTEALQESAGAVNEDVIMIMEQANEQVGNKIVKALSSLWQWIQKVIDSSINFVMTLITSNKKFVEEIKKKVEEKGLTSEDMRNIRMTSYDYKPEYINIQKVKDGLKELESEAKAEYTESDRAKLDEKVQKYNENKRQGAAWEKVQAAKKLLTFNTNENSDWGKFKDEVRLAVQGGEKRTVKTFSMDVFKTIEQYASKSEEVKKAMSDAKTEFKKIIDEISQKAKAAKKGEGDQSFISGKVAYLNYLRSRLSAIADAFAEILHIKLTVLKRQLSDARAFAMHAARYKKSAVKNESAAIIPLDPLFETSDTESEDDGDGDSLEESSFVF